MTYALRDLSDSNKPLPPVRVSECKSDIVDRHGEPYIEVGRMKVADPDPPEPRSRSRAYRGRNVVERP
jgi:hypothetical protein